VNPLTDVDLSAIAARHAAAHGDLIEGLNDPANYDFVRNAHRDMRLLFGVIGALQVQASKRAELLDEIADLHSSMGGDCGYCADADGGAHPWPCPTATRAGASA
jgi:hypothetical protein